MEAIEVKDSDMGDIDMEETRPMRLIDGRLVVWQPLDSCPPARPAEPARSEPSRSEPVRTEPPSSRAAEGTPDDPDATRSMRILGTSEGRRIAPR
jgi:hypothetical protein